MDKESERSSTRPINEAGESFEGEADLREQLEVERQAVRALSALLEKQSAIAPLIARIRDAIATDRCDGESDWAHGVNAACARHLEMIDNILKEKP